MKEGVIELKWGGVIESVRFIMSEPFEVLRIDPKFNYQVLNVKQKRSKKSRRKV